MLHSNMDDTVSVRHLSPSSFANVNRFTCTFSSVALLYSITYNFNTIDESFEWYDLRNRNPEECRLLKGRVDVLSKGVQQQLQQPPLAQAPASQFQGYKSAFKPGQLFT